MSDSLPVEENSTRSVRDAATSMAEQLVKWRRIIHRHPEIGLRLPITSAFVQQVLDPLRLDVTGNADTGLVLARLVGVRPGPTVLPRADMDALPIQEPEGSPFVSEVPGRMHACGHDAHTTLLLGAANILAQRKQDLAGTVIFAFQPGEEGHGVHSA